MPQPLHVGAVLDDDEQGGQKPEQAEWERCGGTGFRGRLGIFEVVEVNDAMRTLILAKPDTAAVLAAARAAGAHTMLEDGLAKAVLGETTITELLRVAA